MMYFVIFAFLSLCFWYIGHLLKRINKLSERLDSVAFGNIELMKILIEHKIELKELRERESAERFEIVRKEDVD